MPRLIRQQIRQRRRALDANQQARAAQELNEQLQKLPLMHNARHIAVYLVNDGELNPENFVRWAWGDNRRCYLPIISLQPQQAMHFARYTPDTRLTPNRFNIPEPDVASEQRVQVSEMDLVLMPLVAFDLQGNRVGMGGGFYDRTLAFKREQSYHQRPKLIGLAYEFQCVPALNPASWDVPLDGIVTPEHTYLFNNELS